jgi:hypothetical protein
MWLDAAQAFQNGSARARRSNRDSTTRAVARVKISGDFCFFSEAQASGPFNYVVDPSRGAVMDQQIAKSREKRISPPSRIVKREHLEQTAVVAESRLLRQASHQVHLVDSIRRLREALGQSRRIALERRKLSM